MIKEEKRTAVYICNSCNIADSLDIKALSEIAENNSSSPKSRCINFLCSGKGINTINKDIKDESLNSLIIAACSSRFKTKEFSFGPDIITERVNLRDHVVNSHIPNDEDTQMLAEDMLRMSLAKLESINFTEPYIPDNMSSDILVVGGGITGITAAIEGAKAGYSIILVEKDKSPGGWSAKFSKQLPGTSPWSGPVEPVVKEKLIELNNLSNIKVLTSTEIENISGQPGNFNISLKTEGKVHQCSTGAIVMATGWKPYNPEKLNQFGYNELKNVITSVEFEQIYSEDSLKEFSSGKTIDNIVFIQCAGSRDNKHLNYCSTVCCGTSLKQAQYLRNILPETNVFIIYKDMRMSGMYENYYKEVQKDNRIFLTKGTVTGLYNEEEQLIAEVENSLIEEKLFIKADLVILATGMVPSDSDELNLNYRQGKGLPLLKYSFPDSHFICFPYETRRTGIYAAGALRSPMSIADCIDDAAGAMLKSIQSVEATKKGKSVFPRSGDTTYPELYMQRCTDCKRCTEECPFGSYDETEKGTPLPNPARCRRCGICLGSCPERIISFSDYSINSVSSMIKAIHMPDEFEEKPRILVFVCENDAYPAFDMAGLKRLKYSAFVRLIPVRCLGSVNNVWVSDALSCGFDGILQIGCKPGDNYQCHFINGSELTEKRGENIQETLDTMMLEPERIRIEFLEINDYHRIPGLIDEYLQIIEEIGPNPFKEL